MIRVLSALKQTGLLPTHATILTEQTDLLNAEQEQVLMSRQNPRKTLGKFMTPWILGDIPPCKRPSLSDSKIQTCLETSQIPGMSKGVLARIHASLCLAPALSSTFRGCYLQQHWHGMQQRRGCFFNVPGLALDQPQWPRKLLIFD